MERRRLMVFISVLDAMSNMVIYQQLMLLMIGWHVKIVLCGFMKPAQNRMDWLM